METLLGMNLLLQVLVLIQIMRFGRLMLQQMKKLECGTIELQGAALVGQNGETTEHDEVHILSKYEVNTDEKDTQKKGQMTKTEDQEVLISEVLSEFF